LQANIQKFFYVLHAREEVLKSKGGEK
jgi:hypothetical protein